MPTTEESPSGARSSVSATESRLRLRKLRAASSTGAITVAAVFALLILVLPGPGIELHEFAGVLLLGLIGTATVAAAPLRSSEPRPYHRILAALVALVGTGTAGLLLATGFAPRALAATPLIGIVVLGALLADSIRVGAYA